VRRTSSLLGGPLHTTACGEPRDLVGSGRTRPVYPMVIFEIFCADIPADPPDGSFSRKAAKMTKG
jgi:hypothetical protein